MKRPSRRIASLGAAAALAAASPASGGDLLSETWGPCIGRSVCALDGLTLIAGPSGATPPARIAEQADPARGAVRGLGVDHAPGNGFNDPELQGPVGSGAARSLGETLTIAYDAPARIDQILILHLYNPTQIPGDPAETAIVTAYLGGERLGRLSVTSLSGGGVALTGGTGASQAAARIAPESGGVVLDDPFPGMALDRLIFSAPAVASGDSADYSVGRVTLSEPRPGESPRGAD